MISASLHPGEMNRYANRLNEAADAAKMWPDEADDSDKLQGAAR